MVLTVGVSFVWNIFPTMHLDDYWITVDNFQTKDTPMVKTKQLAPKGSGACQSTAFVVAKQTCNGLLNCQSSRVMV